MRTGKFEPVPEPEEPESFPAWPETLGPRPADRLWVPSEEPFRFDEASRVRAPVWVLNGDRVTVFHVVEELGVDGAWVGSEEQLVLVDLQTVCAN
jgi:hypothetical protein